MNYKFTGAGSGMSMLSSRNRKSSSVTELGTQGKICRRDQRGRQSQLLEGRAAAAELEFNPKSVEATFGGGK